jgi:hypothetical protein
MFIRLKLVSIFNRQNSIVSFEINKKKISDRLLLKSVKADKYTTRIITAIPQYSMDRIKEKKIEL